MVPQNRAALDGDETNRICTDFMTEQFSCTMSKSATRPLDKGIAWSSVSSLIET